MSPRYVILLAVLLRAGWVLAVATKPVGDFAMYLESAAHLLAHGSLDPEYVYMPGYVAFCAAIFALGGGALAIKLVVAVLSGLTTGAIIGITEALWDRRAALAAGLAYALWPAGIAVGSVTGTDLPAAILVVFAVWVLVRLGAQRPWMAAVAFGLVMGIAATVRAVAVPLAAFSFFYFLSTSRDVARERLRAWLLAVGQAGLAAVIALAVLSPWGFRNQRRYGEWFITDSHGGLTAVVGANPNTDGRYSRSLNRMFTELTGYTLLAEPHRAADRASYEIARDLVRFSPAYAAGLVVKKAERLVAEERSLLYWPVYRAGVLQDGAVKRFFQNNRRVIEVVVDGFYWALVVMFFAGTGVAVARRRWDALWFLPIGLALVGIYALFFAEVRYQLPIIVLLFPIAGGGIVFAADALAHMRRRKRIPSGLRREAGAAVLTVLLAAGGIAGLAWGGQRLVERHRFAFAVAEIAGGDGKTAVLWRHEGGGDSSVRGVWDGVGVRVPTAGKAEAIAELKAPAGKLRITAHWDLAPASGTEPAQAEPAARDDDGEEAADAVAPARTRAPAGADATASLRVGGVVVAEASLAALAEAQRAGSPLSIEGVVEHTGGSIVLSLTVPAANGFPKVASVWLTGLAVASIAVEANR